METSNNTQKYELFNDLPDGKSLQSRLYEEIYPGKPTDSVSLLDFLGSIMLKYNITVNDIGYEEKSLDLTLEYLYPLLKEGKLIVKLTKNICGKGKIYKKEEAKEAIKEIKKRWLELDSKSKKDDFEMFNVQFKLPNGMFIY